MINTPNAHVAKQLEASFALFVIVEKHRSQLRKSKNDCSGKGSIPIRAG
jgi:hypothetical protein